MNADMRYVWAFLIAVLVGGGGGVAFALAPPEVHQAVLSLPWWAGPVTGLVLSPVVAGIYIWWYRRKEGQQAKH